MLYEVITALDNHARGRGVVHDQYGPNFFHGSNLPLPVSGGDGRIPGADREGHGPADVAPGVLGDRPEGAFPEDALGRQQVPLPDIEDALVVHDRRTAHERNNFV